ncbi:odorant receptor 13a-like [Bombyx mandarina]|uniref:Odorant receptor n=1 Tax=Bombyx mandarina TaxID=7092 RepID=A0A6J2JBM4_BOMMA|nr:odorant receptor 13a-like [Bombyx mandarina]
MELLKCAWRKVSHTRALEQSSGRLESLFFESVYRVTYITGLSSSDRTIIYLVYSISVKLMILLLVCGEVWYSISETSSLDEIAAGINATLIQFIAIYRYKNMIDHKDMYKRFATSMESPHFDTSTDKRKKLVVFWAERNEKYLKLLLALGNCTLAAWFLYPLVDELDYNLIVGVHLPFEYKTPSRYPLAYITVVIAFIYVSYFVMVTDLIMQAHLLHLLCQFNVLADCFENMLNDCVKGFEGIPLLRLLKNKQFTTKYTKRLGNLVEQHNRILNNTISLRDTLSYPMLGQLAASGTLICFIGYQATTTVTVSLVKCLMSLLFLCYNVFELYIICLWSEEITIQGCSIGEAIYCSGWECGLATLPGVRSTILLVIARANKPLVLTAGGMYKLSLIAYTTLVKTSYSALTVLLRFRHD